MITPDSLNQVAAFHSLFDAPILPNPQIPSTQRCQLRVELIQEELIELKEAIASNDLTEIADALCDLQYVLSGAVLEFGMGHTFKSMFEEVQRSNMSKACTSLEIAQKTVAHYLQKDGTVSEIKQKGELFLVYRTSDNKVLKSVEYSEANLSKFL